MLMICSLSARLLRGALQILEQTWQLAADRKERRELKFKLSTGQ